MKQLAVALAALSAGALFVSAAAPSMGGPVPMMGSTSCPMMQRMMMHSTTPANHAMVKSAMMMQRSMGTMTFSGNTDRDFLSMMIMHHQAALNMASSELRYGKDPRVLSLARGIIKAQQAEISQMQEWLKEPR